MNTSAIAPIVERTVDRVIDPIVDRFHRLTRNVTYKRRVGTTAIVLGLAVTGGLLIINLLSRAAKRNAQKNLENRHDKTLKGSFPASDPAASQYFDIPVNRQ